MKRDVLYFVVRLVLIVIPALLLIGLGIIALNQSRTQADRVGCMHHLRMIGLDGMRLEILNPDGTEKLRRGELPCGTVLESAIDPLERISWYGPMLPILNSSASLDPNLPRPKNKNFAKMLESYDPHRAWNDPLLKPVAYYRLSTALCPARVPTFDPSQPARNHYIALGGLGEKTPSLSLDEAGRRAGCFRYNSPTPDEAILDGLSQTIALLETEKDIGAWLQGGPSTLRGINETEKLVGRGQQFSGHRNGLYAAFADGSVRFFTYTADDRLLKALVTIAGSERIGED